MILIWLSQDYLTHVTNLDGSIMLFNGVEEADAYIEKREYLDEDARVISIGGV